MNYRAIVFWFSILTFLLCGAYAWGHGAQYTEEEAAWMERQYAYDGMKCCAPYDFHVITDPEWRMREGRYEVFVNGSWHRVPPGRLMRPIPNDPSPFPGQALLFRTNTNPPNVWCFFPPPLM